MRIEKVMTIFNKNKNTEKNLLVEILEMWRTAETPNGIQSEESAIGILEGKKSESFSGPFSISFKLNLRHPRLHYILFRRQSSFLIKFGANLHFSKFKFKFKFVFSSDFCLTNKGKDK